MVPNGGLKGCRRGGGEGSKNIGVVCLNSALSASLPAYCEKKKEKRQMTALLGAQTKSSQLEF